MFISILVFIAFVLMACSLAYHSYLITFLVQQNKYGRKEEPKKPWEFAEKMVPSHLVKKAKEEKKQTKKNVRSLATLESEAMSSEEKDKLLEALTNEDTTI